MSLNSNNTHPSSWPARRKERRQLTAKALPFENMRSNLTLLKLLKSQKKKSRSDADHLKISKTMISQTKTTYFRAKTGWLTCLAKITNRLKSRYLLTLNPMEVSSSIATLRATKTLKSIRMMRTTQRKSLKKSTQNQKNLLLPNAKRAPKRRKTRKKWYRCLLLNSWCM